MGTRLWALIAGVASAYAAGSMASAATTLGQTTRLPAGIVEASDRDAGGVMAFKGIPYAAPPVGRFRWRAPQPVAPWSKPLDASHFGPSCLATGVMPGAGNEEDCLTLNVWTPATSPTAKLPVMVWIPGGGFQSSVSSRINADGAKLAAKGIIVVSLNYRVGVYGFLAHPDLDRAGRASGNWGLQDQIAALDWVRRNIRRFGGDARNVTIAGESAGGVSVALLMAAPSARGLFEKAICESDGFWDAIHGSMQTHIEALSRGKSLADRLTGGNIEALRALPAAQLSEATKIEGRADRVAEGFSPNIDRTIIPEAPAASFARAAQAHIPLLVGFNAAEGASFRIFARPQPNAASYRNALRQWIGAANFAAALQFYPARTDLEVNGAIEQLFGDVFSKEQTWELMQLHSDTSGAPVFGYLFDMHSQYTPSPAHTAEIDYVFGTLQPHWLAPTGGAPGAADQALSGLMMAYWSNFVRSGDPNGPGLPHWPKYHSRDARIVVLDASAAAGPEDSERLRFLRGLRVNGRMPESWREAKALAY